MDKRKIAGLLLILVGIIVVVVIGKAIFKKDDVSEKEQVTISSLSELFANEVGVKYEYKEGENKYKVEVTEVEEKEEVRYVTTQRKVKEENREYIVEMKYEIGKEKVVESGRYIEEGKEVSRLNTTEIIVDGIPYEGLKWKSVDGLTENEITSMRENKVEITSTITEGETKRIERRIIEVGKGVVEIVAE